MKTAFVTMVWKDYWFLDLWIRYNGGLVGRKNLFVISHGEDAEVARIAQGCNLITIPRDDVDENFDETRWGMLSDISSGLVRYYDRVVVGDVDEMIIGLTPGESLIDRLKQVPGPVVAPLGFEIVPETSDELDEQKPILQQSFKAVLSAKYSKPCILTEPTRLTAGGHGARARFEIDPGLALLHLRFLNFDGSKARRMERKSVAEAVNNQAERSGKAFLRGWRNTAVNRRKIADQFWSAPEVTSFEAMKIASEVLENARVASGGSHSFSVPEVRENAIRMVLDEDLRDLF